MQILHCDEGRARHRLSENSDRRNHEKILKKRPYSPNRVYASGVLTRAKNGGTDILGGLPICHWWKHRPLTTSCHDMVRLCEMSLRVCWGPGHQRLEIEVSGETCQSDQLSILFNLKLWYRIYYQSIRCEYHDNRPFSIILSSLSIDQSQISARICEA